MKSWYANYSKNYRDLLVHRIPLYVPPSILDKSQGEEFQKIEAQKQALNLGNLDDIEKYNELFDKQTKLGKACLFFSHSMSEGNRPVYFHAQVIADYLTVEEMIYKFCKNFRN
jgi:hypothetical protein